jgi:hypothetical protein
MRIAHVLLKADDSVAFLSFLLLTAQVLREGMYDVAAIYSSQRQAPFKLAVGMHEDIQAGAALSIRVQLPQQVSRQSLVSMHYGKVS